MEFLKVLVIIIASYYALKFGLRLMFPFLMKKLAQKMMRNAQQGGFSTGDRSFQYQNFGQQERQQPKTDGKVKVAYVPPKEDHKNGASTAGEFVDFEEVK
ncbi:DUF4834 family protein [Sphingobacterium corticis]|uniref:DUF4834 family protein n=1 Tax=Sphingobacterium corticis TaxID=1812823 RepID=A0ABW5NNX6_9SPHI